ncbi:cytochrome ubiquinol oxidase subunit I, partial [Paraburkholderia sp. BR14319]|uniref:cytochrome ubiquinol oxidase subunit I n=1 Tax=Paraburkholderia sp. BR14319 TaxID=3237005 RepID=UPI0034D34F7E
DADVLGAENVLRLITIRSHDQYNTTIYAMDDRYRGVFGRRDVPVKRSFSMALWILLFLAPIQILVGDAHGLNTREHQPAK